MSWRHLAGILSGAFVSLLLAGPAAAAEAPRVAVVNVQRVLAQSKAGRAAKEELEKEKVRLEASIKSKRGALEKIAKEARDLQLEIEQKSAIWREEERDKKTFDLRQKRRDLSREEDNFKRLVGESRRDLGERQRKLTLQVIKELRDVVHELGKEEKFDLIVDSAAGGVLYSTPLINITDKVIQRYDKIKNK